MKNFAPAAERNKQFIADVLARILPARGLVLEVASGSGQHVAHFAAALPDLEFLPTDADEGGLDSIQQWVSEAGVTNVRAPVALDARAKSWPVDQADAVLCINMIHIAPWDACLGLVAGAARVLPAGAPLVLYGPFARGGVLEPDSNVQFDQSLRRMHPAWGVRDLDDVVAAASEHALSLDLVIDMPANNHVVVLRKGAR